jgi:xanthine dehydrogenase accessory factor
MLEQVLKQSAELLAKGETFAMATVVRCHPPTSGKPGDKAIIHNDGKLSGWIGGGCAQPVVIREALKALADGKPRLVRISPSSDGREEGVVDYTMTCHSGGSLDIYIEPVLPNLHVVILGRSPVARTLARLARAVGYEVSAVVPAGDADGFGDSKIITAQDFSLSQVKITPQTYIVVSTQGEGDEEALEQAVQALQTLQTLPAAEPESESMPRCVPYIAFVASKTKAGKVLDYLRTKGIAAEKLQQVRAPAGLNLGAASPEEIAVSILAEIVQVHRSKAVVVQQENAPRPIHAESRPGVIKEAVSGEAKDPICGMMVDTSQARYKSEYGGQWFYFCCGRCQQEFEKAPAQHATFA